MQLKMDIKSALCGTSHAVLLAVVAATGGCKEANPPVEAGKLSTARQAADSKGQTVARSAAATPTTTPTSSDTRFHPVEMDGFYQRQFMDYRPTDSWAQVPRGETNLGGVPFLMFGKIDLTGLGRARDGEFQPAGTGEIPA